MDYQKLYNNIISNPITTGYTEKHHIVPKSLGGTDDESNLIQVSARQHFLLHWLLIKMHTGDNRKKMVHAFMCMKADRNNRGRVTSRVFEYYRQEYAESLTGRKRAPFSKEWRLKLSKASAGKNNGMYGKTHSDKTKQLMSKKAKLRKHSDKTKQKIAESVRGKKREKKLCVHCNQEVAVNGYARWHGDNCKHAK